MKLHLVLLLLFPTILNAQILTEVDSLETKKDVEYFINKLDSSPRKNIKLRKVKFHKEVKHLYDSLPKISVFQKADFDNNGYTDLLITQRYFISVYMNYGKNIYERKYVVDLYDYSNFQKIPIVNTMNNAVILELYSIESKITDKNIKDIEHFLTKKSLIYKFGNFIEQNPAPKNNKIEKIEFHANGCFGNCPICKINIEVNINGKAELNAILHNTKNNIVLKGDYKTVIETEHLIEIIQLLNYIDFENLKDKYETSKYDGPTYAILIIYNNGQKKLIVDYTFFGTYGLELLYQKLLDLRFNQDWTKF